MTWFCGGSGDPWLVIERFWLLAKELRDRGITHIHGDLVIDDTLFDRRAIETQAIDGKPMRTYNTPPNALLVNFGATSLIIDSDHSTVHVSADPPATTLKISNTVDLSKADCEKKGRSIRLDLKKGASVTKLSVAGATRRAVAPAHFAARFYPMGGMSTVSLKRSGSSSEEHSPAAGVMARRRLRR